MAEDLSHWTPRARPEAAVLEGRLVRLERLDPERHAEGLFDASTVADAAERFRWLPEVPPVSRAAFRDWVAAKAQSLDPIFYAVLDRAPGAVMGRQTLMRIDVAHGVAAASRQLLLLGHAVKQLLQAVSCVLQVHGRAVGRFQPHKRPHAVVLERHEEQRHARLEEV